MPGRLTGGPRRALLLVAAQLGVAVLVGWLWAAVWNPPTGVAYEGRFVPVGEAGYRAFSATGSYVLWCAAAGLLLGLLTALVRRGELVLLAVGAATSAVAALVVARVGEWLGPPDPQLAAQQSGDFSPVAVALEVNGWTAYLAWPAAFLLGMLLVLLLVDPAPSGDPVSRPGRSGRPGPR